MVTKPLDRNWKFQRHLFGRIQEGTSKRLRPFSAHSSDQTGFPTGELERPMEDWSGYSDKQLEKQLRSVLRHRIQLPHPFFHQGLSWRRRSKWKPQDLAQEARDILRLHLRLSK